MFVPPSLQRYLPIMNQVWRLSFPVILTFLLQSLVNLVDVFMAGRLGPVQIAAVGMATTLRLLVFVGILSVTAGAMSLAAQAKGARDPAHLSFVAKQSLLLTTLLALALSVLGYFAAEPLLTFLNSGNNPLAVTLGTSYLQILFIGTVFLTGNLAVNSLMQGAGDTVTPLYLSGATNLLNIVFSYLLIFGPGPLPALGLDGAALGTVAARALAVGAGLYLFYSGKNVVKILPGSYLPDLTMFRDILAIGIPSGLQGVARNAAQLFVMRIVTSTAAGTYGAAALAIGLQVESFSFMPGIAISVAATSLVGQSLGAWQLGDAKLRGNLALLLGAVVMTSIAIPLLIFAPQLVMLFEPSAHPTVVSAGASYIRINALAQPVLAIAMVINGALRGAGDTRPGLVGTIIGRWLVVVPLAYLLALVLDFGVQGVWWALVAGTSVQALYILLRWRSRVWVEVALYKTKLYRNFLQPLPKEVQQRYLEEVRAPLMARADATEHVNADGVVYRLEHQEVHIRFSENDYEVVTRPDIPDTPAPNRAIQPRTAPAYN